MTTVKIFKQNGSIQRVLCDGHTGYGVQGEDIVCAALSSIVQTAALGLMGVLGIDISLNQDDQKGFFEFCLPQSLSPQKRQGADLILDTMLLGIADLNESYSDFIELEVKYNVY